MTTAAPPRDDVNLEQLVGDMSRTCELYLDPGLGTPCPNSAGWLVVTRCDCPPGRDVLVCEPHADDLRRAIAQGYTLRCPQCGTEYPLDLRPLP